MAAAEADDDHANAMLDLAASHAHSYRERLREAANDASSSDHAAAKLKLAHRADAARARRQPVPRTSEQLEQLAKRKKKAIRIAKKRMLYDEQRAEEAEAKRQYEEAVLQAKRARCRPRWLPSGSPSLGTRPSSRRVSRRGAEDTASA